MLLCYANWTHDPITVATVIIAASAVVNILVSAGLFVATYRTATIAKLEFEAANRPYVGVELLDSRSDPQNKRLEIVATVRNFGTVPAEETAIDWDVLLDGVSAPSDPRMPDIPFTLFPTNSITKHATLRQQTFENVMTASVKLTVLVWLSYKGPSNKSYAYSEKSQYDPDINRFFRLGPIKVQQPTGKRGKDKSRSPENDDANTVSQRDKERGDRKA